jgi:hypothetical protein
MKGEVTDYGNQKGRKEKSKEEVSGLGPPRAGRAGVQAVVGTHALPLRGSLEVGRAAG